MLGSGTSGLFKVRLGDVRPPFYLEEFYEKKIIPCWGEVAPFYSREVYEKSSLNAVIDIPESEWGTLNRTVSPVQIFCYSSGIKGLALGGLLCSAWFKHGAQNVLACIFFF